MVPCIGHAEGRRRQLHRMRCLLSAPPVVDGDSDTSGIHAGQEGDDEVVGVVADERDTASDRASCADRVAEGCDTVDEVMSREMPPIATIEHDSLDRIVKESAQAQR